MNSGRRLWILSMLSLLALLTSLVPPVPAPQVAASELAVARASSAARGLVSAPAPAPAPGPGPDVAGPWPAMVSARLDSTDPHLSIATPPDPLPVGASFTATVEISGVVEPLSAFQFDLDYDPASLKVIGVEPGPFLGSEGRPGLCPDPAYPGAGTIRFACAGAGEAAGPTGSGSLAIVTFSALDAGTHALALSAIQLPGEEVPPQAMISTDEGGQVTVEPDPAVALTGGQTLQGQPGTVVTHVFTVTNLAVHSDAFTLTVSGQKWPTVPAAESTGPLAASEEMTVAVEVEVSSGIQAEVVASDTFTLTATSGWDSGVNDSDQATTLANAQPAVGLSEDSALGGAPGATVRHIFAVTNEGDYRDTFALVVSGGAWPTELAAVSAGPLEPDEWLTVPVTVEIPTGIQAVVVASDTFTLTATSGWDDEASDSTRGTTLSNAMPAVALSEDSTLGGAPGATVRHVFTVTNEGDYRDTFALAVSGGAWPTELASDSTGPLAVDEWLTVPVTVEIPAGIQTGIQAVYVASDTFTLMAASGWDPGASDSAQGKTLARVGPACVLSGDTAGAGDVGTTLVYSLKVTNAGDYTDTFSLSVDGATWPSTLSDESSGPLASQASSPFTLSVSIPEVMNGAQDVALVRAVSSLDPGVSDEQKVRTTALQGGYRVYLPAALRDYGPAATSTVEAPPPGPEQPDQAGEAPADGLEAGPEPPPLPLPTARTGTQARILSSCYATDLDCDQQVDEGDLALVIDGWNCAVGDSCYDAAHDLDADGRVTALDLAWVGNDYDIRPPKITILSPGEGSVGSPPELLVSGTVSDAHQVVSVTVQSVVATLVGSAFAATVPVSSGNQTLYVEATNALGQTGLAGLVARIDGDGPMVRVEAPRDRQSVYTVAPTIRISYTDLYTGVNTASLSALIVGPGGASQDVTSDLVVGDKGAQGTLSTPLTGDRSYMLTVSVDDDLGNSGSASSTFYVPPDPASIEPPVEPEYAGWVSGVVYDSSTCNEHLTECDGLPGAGVTLAYSGGVDIDGTVVTGPGGFFAFPLAKTDDYWLRVEKTGYTYGQRAATVVAERSTATNEIYLTPIDPALTVVSSTITQTVVHTNTDETLVVEIPPGAVQAGQLVSVTATNFPQVEFLPSGELPAGTFETYAFNLGGDAEVTFTQPITVRLLNNRVMSDTGGTVIGFAPGFTIPLGYWNQATMHWEHEGIATVDPTGQWLEMQIDHFSNFDPNMGAGPGGDLGAGIGDGSDDDEGSCQSGESGCIVGLQSGNLEEEIHLATVNVLGEEMGPRLVYHSGRASPAEVFKVSLDLEAGPGVELGDYVGYELYVEGTKTDSYSFSSDLGSGTAGPFRFHWDGRDAQGQLLPPGVYDYRIVLKIPYTAEYCWPVDGLFGSEPDCVNWGTGYYTPATRIVESRGTIELYADTDKALGTGWVLDGLQRLYENEIGQIMVVDSKRADEFYYVYKDTFGQSGSPTEEATVTTLNSMAGGYRTPAPALAADLPLPPGSNAIMAAGINACGTIVTDTVWAAGSHVVTCDVDVAAGVTLTIEAGAVVQFSAAPWEISVKGGLVVSGTEASPVYFRPQTTLSPGQWGRIAYQTGSWGRLEHAVLRYGGGCYSGQDGSLYIASDDVEVLHSVVQNGAKTGIVIDGTSPLISATQILTNTWGQSGAGVWIDGGDPTIMNSIIQDNIASQSGGGIYLQSGNPALRGNHIQGNRAGSSTRGGGGLYVEAGTPIVEDSTFEENWAYNAGGAIYNLASTFAIQDCTFDGNSTDYSGGAFYNQGGNPTIRDNLFRANHGNSGGALYVHLGNLNLDHNTWDGNWSTFGGGAVYHRAGSGTIQRGTFVGNWVSSSSGGAIDWIGGSNGAIENSTFFANQAPNGAGINFEGGSLTIDSNTFYSNTATTNGGAVRSTKTTLTIRNNIIVSNTATAGGGVYGTIGMGANYNNTWQNVGGDYFQVTVGPQDISLNPSFVNVDGVDLHLSYRSPCIDAADPDNHPDLDYDSDPRPLGIGPDIGADEWKSEQPVSRTTTDYSRLEWNRTSNAYTRIYPDGTEVHFDAEGRHDQTLAPDGRKTTYTYNPDDSLASMNVIPPGDSTPRWTWAFAYQEGGLAQITDPSGRVTQFTIDAQNNLVAVLGPDGAIRQFSYDQEHHLTQDTNEQGAITTYTYDDRGRISTIADPPRTIYDAATGQSEVGQSVRRFTVSESGYVLINDSPVGDPENPAPEVPGPDVLVSRVEYGRGERSGHTNKWGWWLDLSDGLGRTTYYTYDEAGNQIQEKRPNGDCVEYRYNDLGLVLGESWMGASQCVLDPENRDPAQVQTWSYTYDDQFNQLKTLTDPLGYTTTLMLDYELGLGTAGKVVQIHYPSITTTTGSEITPTVVYSYNGWGLLATEVDPQGRVTRYVYSQGTPEEASGGGTPLFTPGVTPVPGLLTQLIVDYGDGTHLNLTTTYKDFTATGQPGTVIDERGAVSTYTYDTLDRVLTLETDLGHVTQYEYDARGNRVRMVEDYTADGTTGRNLVTTYTYDVQDRLLCVRTPVDGMVFENNHAYDINGMLAMASDAQGRTTIYTYDEADQMIAQVDPLGQTTHYSYTLNAELENVTYPDGQVLRVDFDERGNPTGVTPPGRPVHTFAYDGADRPVAYAPPDVGAGSNDTLFHYNALSLQVRVERSDAQTLVYGYDDATRLSRVTVPRGQIDYGNDPATGQLTSLSAPGGIDLALAYDGSMLDELAWTGPVSGTVGMTYDKYGRLTSQRVNGADAIDYQYTADHLPLQAGDLALSYKHQSGLLSETTLGQVSDLLEYTAFGELARYAATVDGAPFYEVRYAYDSLARIRTLTETVSGVSRVYSYTYDNRDRLQGVHEDGTLSSTYSYDGNGNRLNLTTSGGVKVGTYDDQDRMLLYGTTAYSYTAHGEVKSATTAGQTTTYDYDTLGNLMAVNLPDGTEIDYLVDGQNRRIGKKIGGVLVQGFLYQDGLKPVAELDGAGNVVSRFVYASRAHVPDYLVKGGVAYRILSDHLGSPRLVVDTTTGTVAQEMVYDEFGRVIQDTNPGFQPFGFAGGLYDPHTGLTRFGARDYNAETGRWMAKDPILFGGLDPNLYSYVGNDPLSETDPTGLGASSGCGGSAGTGSTSPPRRGGESPFGRWMRLTAGHAWAKIVKILPSPHKSWEEKMREERNAVVGIRG